MKKLINVTDIISYLYCPRKIYLKLIKGIKEPPTKQMISGFIKHKVFDVFNKNESLIVGNIKENLTKEEIKNLYIINLTNIVNEILNSYQNMVLSFSINSKELIKDILEMMKKDIILRAESIKKSLDLSFLGKELWRNLQPKYLTEFEIVSEELGLKGRIDRIKLEEEILPYEIKTREEIYESDKLQLAAYSLLLEQEFNKKIEKGVIEAKNKQEEILITEEMKNKVLEIADKIRNLKEASFNNNFSKCESCRLKEKCFEL